MELIDTPNPNAKKIDIDMSSTDIEKELNKIEGVKSVFFGPNFVTITKGEKVFWEHIKPAILGTIMEFIQSGKEIIEGKNDRSAHASHAGPDVEVVKKITDLLDTRIRPAVAKMGAT